MPKSETHGNRVESLEASNQQRAGFSTRGTCGLPADNSNLDEKDTVPPAGPVPNPGYRMYPSSHPRDPCGGTVSATSPDPLASLKATANGKRPLGAPRV